MTDTHERPGLSRAEPPPIPNDSPAIADLVIADMLDRKAAGIAKYGVALQAGNGRRPLIDAYQEALDLTVYLRQAIAEGYIPRADYDEIAAELSQARDACVRATEGPWIWAGDGDDGLDSMTSDSVVSITVLQLRGLLENAREEWRSTAMRYQARHAGLRGLQLAVTDATKRLSVIADSGHTEDLDAIVDQLVEANRASVAGASESLFAQTDRKPEPLPSVETLQQWMVDRTPIFLTFESGSRADLPSSGAVQRGIVAIVGRSGIAVEHDGTMHAFDFVKPPEAWKIPYVSWLTSIGARRDTVLLPVERPWVNATDPIVETWVGREIECMSAMTESWACVLVAIEGTVLRTDYSDHGDVVCDRVPRKHLQVRLVSEVSK
jgi:hypothetical protein